MYLTVCPLCGPGQDSSMGEITHLTVCPLRGQGSIPTAMAEYFEGSFPADLTLSTRPEPAWQKIAQSSRNSSTQSVDIEEEGQSRTMNRQ